MDHYMDAFRYFYNCQFFLNGEKLEGVKPFMYTSLRHLNIALQEAVDIEDYETAAILRDKINEYEDSNRSR